MYWKKIIRYFNILVLISGLLIPLFLFLNRFLIPDVSFDSINYHLYLGYKGLNWENNKFEFYPTGIHNFATILEIPGYMLMKLFGYRVGTVGGLIFLYLSIFVVYKIFKLYNPKFGLLDKWWSGLLFISTFLSFESFLQIATYYADIEVMFLMLLSIYFLFKYEKTNRLRDIAVSACVTSVFVLGKMTTWYYLFPYFGYLLFILFNNKKLVIKEKIFCFLLTGIISVILVIPWLYNNFVLTGNPVFPFYNAIFKSEFFVPVNFSQLIFGGRNLFEKFFWGIVSIKYPVRLGEVHDLFTDYKINIYFIAAILALFWSVYKKNYKFLKFVIFYLGLYMSWSLSFGYLRYGLILEVLGGLLLLIAMYEIVDKRLNILQFIIIIIVIFQSYKIFKLSVAYDISFRPSYYFNKVTYKSELSNLFSSQISLGNKLIDKYKPNVYLNCATPNMGYYVLSNINKLPVIEIDSLVYGGMSLNSSYIKKINNLLNPYLDNNIRFVTITLNSGLNVQYKECINNLKINNYSILDEVKIDNFLGYKGQKLVVIFGEKIL